MHSPLQLLFSSRLIRFPFNYHMQMLTYGRVMPFLELFSRIDAVNSTTIMETAKEYIIDKVYLQH
jgi:hypothetical protein